MSNLDLRTEPAAWVRGVMEGFLTASPLNDLGMPAPEPAWDRVLVGFAAGDDPIWIDYKQHVGPYHFTPAEIFNLHFPGNPARPADLTVISYVLPQRAAVKADNRREDFHPAERWVRARFKGEEVSEALRQDLVAALMAQGVDCLAPSLSPHWKWVKDRRWLYSSLWSERHAAHAAGLGTFGVCDGLITRAGKAHRAGSVVARLAIPATPRTYRHHKEWCLYYREGTCLACVKRCPVGALSAAGHHKRKCWDHAGVTCAAYAKERFGMDGYGCGLCQTGVPCESCAPGID